MTFSPRTIEAAATAIANARGMRRGAPPVSNILDVLKGLPKIGNRTIYDDLIEDATAALEAAAKDIEAERTEAVKS